MPSELTKIRDEIETLIEDDHDDPAALAAVIADRVVGPLLAARSARPKTVEPERSKVQAALDALDDLLYAGDVFDIAAEDLDAVDAWANNVQLDIARHRRTRGARRA